MKKLFVLILGVLLLVGCGSKEVVSTKKNSEKESKKEEEVVEVTSQEKDQILDAVNKLHDFDFYTKEIKVKDLDNQTLLVFVTNYRLFNDYSTYDSALTLSEAEDIISKTLYDVEITPEDIPCSFCGTTNLIYNKNKKVFEYNPEHGGHGYSDTVVYNRLKDVEYKDGRYIATVYKAISEFYDVGYPERYYASMEDASNYDDMSNYIFKMKLDSNYEIIGNPKDEFLKVPDDKLVEHIYTFVKEDGNFLLESYKINK